MLVNSPFLHEEGTQLTLCRNEQAMQFEGQQRIRQLLEEFLEQGSKLHRVIRCKVTKTRILLELFNDFLKTTNVAVLPEDTLNGYIWSNKLSTHSGY
jgi:hypothetical protein